MALTRLIQKNFCALAASQPVISSWAHKYTMVLILNDSPSFPTRSICAYRIATALRLHGVEVEVIDFISRWPWDELMTYLKSKGPIEWLGISSKFGRETQVSDPPVGPLLISKVIRRFFPTT